MASVFYASTRTLILENIWENIQVITLNKQELPLKNVICNYQNRCQERVSLKDK